MSEFREALHVGITLTAGGQTAQADGGSVKELQLSLEPYGWRGAIRIWVDASVDDFFEPVCSTALLEAELEVSKALYKVRPAPAPLKVAGLVTARQLREITSEDVGGNPILYREYRFELCDAAAALWSQHHPSVVYAKTSWAKMIADNTPEGLTVRTPWPVLSKVRPMVCLGLGAEEASFYDFAFWLAHAEGGHVWYDYAKRALVFDTAKPNAGAVQELAFGAIESSMSFRVTFAPPPRAAVKLMNSREGATAELDVEQPNSAAGVRHDFLIHTALNAEAEARKTALATRFSTGLFDVRVDCDAYPEMYLAPGSRLTLAGEFGSSFFVSGQTLRVTRLELDVTATNQTPEYDIENTTTEYAVRFGLELEAAQDSRFRGFPYRAPRYPLRVEGKVLSAIGGEGDRSYTIDKDPEAGDTYKLKLALWNTIVTVPVAPDFMPGHLYFPVYKDSRVMALLELDSARIERFLEWGPGATVPSQSQGNHLLLGKNSTSETSIKHWYVDNAPELVIERVNAGDTATVTVKEGTLTLELTEEGSSSGFGTTVSVEPQAQMAKTEASQKSELAIADLQTSAQGATAELAGTASTAAGGIRQEVEQLSSRIRAKAKEIERALGDVGAGIDEQVQAAEGLITETRSELEELWR